MFEKLKHDFRPITWLLIPIAVIVNGAGGWIIAKLNIPFYFDTLGTIFIAIVAGPFAGAITGVITNVILGIVSPGYLPYWPVPLLIGLTAGLFANAGWFKRWWKVVIVGLVIAVIASVASTWITVKVFGDITLSPFYFLVEEPLDKISTALIAYGIVQLLPKKILAFLPRPENVDTEKK